MTNYTATEERCHKFNTKSEQRFPEVIIMSWACTWKRHDPIGALSGKGGVLFKQLGPNTEGVWSQLPVLDFSSLVEHPSLQRVLLWPTPWGQDCALPQRMSMQYIAEWCNSIRIISYDCILALLSVEFGVFCNCSNELASVVTYRVNLSLSEGNLPSSWNWLLLPLISKVA